MCAKKLGQVRGSRRDISTSIEVKEEDAREEAFEYVNDHE